MKRTLEVACFDYASALIAAENGVSRIEYCANYSIGGTTPDLKSTEDLLANVNTPVFVMLRNNEGFYFDENEFEGYREKINAFKRIGANGFVIGFLNHQNKIDLDFNKRLVELIKPLPCTFHRAVDYTSNYLKSVEQLIALGFDRVLTSGGRGNATDFIQNLREVQKNFGQNIVVMPGGGIRANNIQNIAEQTGCTEYHTAARINNTINAQEIKTILEQLNNE